MPFDRGNTAHFTALKNELTADPRVYGYGTNVAAENYVALADQLNVPRTAANGGTFGVISVRRGKRTSLEVMSCIDNTGFEGLVVARREYLIALVSPGEVDLANDVVRASLAALFVSGNINRTRLVAIADKTPASRFEEQWGIDERADEDLVRTALRNF